MTGDARPTGGKIWARPIVRVTDLAASVAFYCQKLGFAQDWIDGGEDPAVAQCDPDARPAGVLAQARPA